VFDFQDILLDVIYDTIYPVDYSSFCGRRNKKIIPSCLPSTPTRMLRKRFTEKGIAETPTASLFPLLIVAVA